jgi:hypothetical protein
MHIGIQGYEVMMDAGQQYLLECLVVEELLWTTTQRQYAPDILLVRDSYTRVRFGPSFLKKRRNIGVALVEFWDAYKKALELWRSGVRDVVFPAGTYAIRVLHGVMCESWVPG